MLPFCAEQEFFESTTTRDSTRRPTSSTSRGSAAHGLGSTGAMTAGSSREQSLAAGGNCNNGPLGSDAVVDTSVISPDQQFEAGLFCGGVRATPSSPISSSLGANLCPAGQYGSTLLSIPRPGTENDDKNPPRISQRSLFDLALGHDNVFRGDKYKVSLQLTAINLTNRVALYNFLSTFSGTHYVTPRTFTMELGFHF